MPPIEFISIFRCLLCIQVLSKHLSVIQKLRFTDSTFLSFAQNCLHDFQNTVNELIVALSSTNATKKKKHYRQSNRSNVDFSKLFVWRGMQISPLRTVQIQDRTVRAVQSAPDLRCPEICS